MLSGHCILISKFKKTVFLKNRIIQRKQSNSNSPSFILCQLLFSEKSRINAQTKKMGPLGPLILIRLEPILPLCPRHCRVDRKYRICSVFQTNQRERGQKTQLRSFIRTHWFKPFRQWMVKALSAAGTQARRRNAERHRNVLVCRSAHVLCELNA